MNQTPLEQLECYRFLPRFKSLPIEQEFRSAFLTPDRSLARFIYSGAVFIALASIVPDMLADIPMTSRIGGHGATASTQQFNINILKTQTLSLLDGCLQ